MTNFRRVSDSESMPEYMAERFANTSQASNNPYAELEASRHQRKAQISRESLSYDEELNQRTIQSQNKSWEKIPTAATYSQPYESETDAFGSAIRRVLSGSEVDTGTRANPAEFEFCTREQGEDMMIRGAGIFSPDILEYQIILDQKMKEHGGYNERQEYASPEEKRRLALQSRMESRQATHYAPSLRARQEIESRSPLLLNKSAQSVIRVSDETAVAGAFGLPDYQQLLSEERNRHERVREQKEITSSIKRKGTRTAQEKHSDWESTANVKSRSYQQSDNSNSWMDSYIKSLG